MNLEHASIYLFHIDVSKQNYYKMICNAHNVLYSRDCELSE